MHGVEEEETVVKTCCSLETRSSSRQRQLYVAFPCQPASPRGPLSLHRQAFVFSPGVPASFLVLFLFFCAFFSFVFFPSFAFSVFFLFVRFVYVLFFFVRLVIFLSPSRTRIKEKHGEKKRR